MKKNSLLVGYMLLSCVLPVSAQTINEDFKITASDAAMGDRFGTVAISGTTVIVGSVDDDDSGSNSGSAYIFDMTTNQQLFKITASDGAADDSFGYSVAISGSTAIVGARLGSNGGLNSGSAYLFDTNTGQQLFMLDAPDAEADDNFGYAVSISGNTVLVGAPTDDDDGSNSGSAYLFDVTTGQMLFKLTASDAAAGDLFGASVSLSGNSAIVSAIGDDSLTGSVYVFDTTTGMQLDKLTSPDAATNDNFGLSVALYGNTAVIGAPFDDSIAGGDDSGSAYIFDIGTGQQLFKIAGSVASPGDIFGASVSISGSLAIVGAHSNAPGGGAYAFDTVTGQQRFMLRASDAATDDSFGGSVAISGNTVLVGASNDDDDGGSSGSVYGFLLPPDINSQPQSILVSEGETAVFTVGVTNTSGTQYRWRRDGVEMSDGGNISGSDSPALQIIAQASDLAVYDCVITNPVQVVSEGAVLGIRADPDPCVADLNGDNELDFLDISEFLSAYSNGCP